MIEEKKVELDHFTLESVLPPSSRFITNSHILLYRALLQTLDPTSFTSYAHNYS